MNVVFIGTGLLGTGMVQSMRRRGVGVTVWNRTESKSQALAAFGATVAGSPEEAVDGAAEVHLVLSDDQAVDEVLGRIAPALAASATVIDHTTASPAGTRARLQRAAAAGQRLLHAPVFMSPHAAKESGGVMLVSGPQDVFDAVRDSLAGMTADLWYLGEREDLAAALKIFGNSMLFAMSAGIADILAMARNLEIAPDVAVGVFDRFNAGGAMALRAKKVARGDFSASFELTMARKDMRLMLEAAGAEALVALPAIAARMDQAIAAGRGSDDLSVIAAPPVAPKAE